MSVYGGPDIITNGLVLYLDAADVKSNTYRPIIAKVADDFTTGWELSNSNGLFRCTMRPTATLIDITWDNLGLNRWYYAGFTYNSSNNNIFLYLNAWHEWTFVLIQSTFTINVYIDGIYILTFAYTDWGSIDKESAGSSAVIGSHSGGSWFYNGYISNIKIYNKALSSTEILQNYNALKGRFI
jgi:hypothetical protein